MANQEDTTKKNKHLRLEDRKEIEDCLHKSMSFKSIARLIQKDPTTISYEIKHHRQKHRNSFTDSDEPCPQLLKAPYVCNGCPKRSSASCHYVHYYYRAVPAQQEYRETLTEAREGTPLNSEIFYQVDKILTNGVRKGQHIYQIMANTPAFPFSRSTVYRHSQKGYYSFNAIELPRAVKFKPRKPKTAAYVPAGVKIGRSYAEFIDYCRANDIENHVELDTLVGRAGGKVIMTVHFTCCNFMVGLLMQDKTAAEGALHFAAFKDTLRAAGFSIKTMMKVLLCDNGGEFADVFSFENDRAGHREIPLYFCDPMRSSQKPFIEKNHTLFRDIVPSGSSFDDFTQDTVNLIFSHVNATSRPMFCGRTPYELFSFFFGDETPRLLGIQKIEPKDVIQSPKLLKGLVDLRKNLDKKHPSANM